MKMYLKEITKKLAKKVFPVSLVLTTSLTPLPSKAQGHYEDNYCQSPIVDVEFNVLPNPSPETILYYKNDDPKVFDSVEKEKKVSAVMWVTTAGPLEKQVKKFKGLYPKIRNSIQKYCLKHHKPKQRDEFQPPELPYCKINYAGMEGLDITYWDYDGRKHELSWIVENITEGIGGATISLQASYTHGDYGIYELSSKDYSEVVNCVVRALVKNFV